MTTVKKGEMPKLPKGRFFFVKHQPSKKATPLRLELRESITPNNEVIVPSLSRLIGFEDTVADETTLYEAGLRIIARAGRVDEFIGIYGVDS